MTTQSEHEAMVRRIRTWTPKTMQRRRMELGIDPRSRATYQDLLATIATALLAKNKQQVEAAGRGRSSWYGVSRTGKK